MSTLAFAALTTKREQATPGQSRSTEPPGVGTYIDALAALVPAEVLAAHALIVSATTQTVEATTRIIASGTLYWAFFGLVLLSVVFYAVPRGWRGKWDRLDFARVAIPPLAFVGWTMLQRATAFDAVFPRIGGAPRTVIAVFLGAVLGLFAVLLAYQADQKNPITIQSSGKREVTKRGQEEKVRGKQNA